MSQLGGKDMKIKQFEELESCTIESTSCLLLLELTRLYDMRLKDY